MASTDPLCVAPNRSSLGQLLCQNRTLILKIWEERVRKELDSAKTTDTITLHNALPSFLGRLAVILDEKGKNIENKTVTTAQVHGEQRAEQTDYSLEEVIREYFILRNTIFEVLEPQYSLSQDEREIILMMIETAVRNATTEFVRRQFEKFRAEQSRYESLVKEGESRDQFIHLLVHDLKNPLTSVKLSLGLLSNRDVNSNGFHTLVHRIRGDIIRLEYMITDLLDVSRIKAGIPIFLKLETCDLSELVERVIRDYSLIYSNRFLINGPKSLKGVWGKDSLRRAIENLVSNAVKYGDRGKPISLDFGMIQNRIWISVHNWGNPIPGNEINGLFRPFHRISATEISDRTGWGLGLVQVKAVAEAHQGTVSVNSTPNSGTTFRMEFPNLSPTIPNV